MSGSRVLFNLGGLVGTRVMNLFNTEGILQPYYNRDDPYV